jgi:hypothetical protein
MSLKEIPEKCKKYDNAKVLLVDNCYIPKEYEKPFTVSMRPILNPNYALAIFNQINRMIRK